MPVFSAIRGQDAAVETLRRALGTGRVHHAYLFVGPEGVGKRLTAVALAAALNCHENGCGSCAACRKVRAGTHPDVRMLEGSGASGRIAVDAVREAISWLATRAHEGRSKVLIIDPAHAMTEAAANALLKTLEEPRPGHHLVLVSSAPASLLPTVRSRCQKVRFPALPGEVVHGILVDEGVAEADAQVAAAAASGSVARARELLSEESHKLFDHVALLVEAITAPTAASVLEAADALRDRGTALEVLGLFLVVLDELMWWRSGERTEPGPILDLVSQRVPGKIRPGDPAVSAGFVAAVHRTMEAISNNNMNPQAAVEAMLLHMRDRRRPDAWERIGAL